jgi:hypothetical protein
LNERTRAQLLKTIITLNSTAQALSFMLQRHDGQHDETSFD